MTRAYHQLLDEPRNALRAGAKRELTEAEEELLRLLKSRGVPSICDAISNEIHYVWAVTSGFKTLASVAHFYFACGSQTFGYNPAVDFFAANGMPLALFALHKFSHNESVLVPVLECIHIYSKLHVDGALEFLAVDGATDILMTCVRIHDNRHDVISAACQALGSLVMNDLVKETIASSSLVRELLGLVKRYHASQPTCRGALVPLGFLVTDAAMTAAFVDANGIALTFTAMRRFIHDAELVWHAIGILNGLHAKTVDARLIVAALNFTGVQRLVEALATHLATEEIAVDGFQLLAKLATHREAFAAVNAVRVLDLAYVALFAYAGPQHRHTRLAIKQSLRSFQRCTLDDAQALAFREQPSKADVLCYTLLLLCSLLASALSLYECGASDVVRSVDRALVDRKWVEPSIFETVGTAVRRGRTLRDVNSVDDVWRFLLGPLHDTLFPDRWYNGDAFAGDTHAPLGAVERTNALLGGLQLRVLRVRNVTCNDQQLPCYPSYSRAAERTSTLIDALGVVDHWTAAPTHAVPIAGRLASYPASGYRRIIVPQRNASTTSSTTTCGPYCTLAQLRASSWLDRSTRALVAEFNLYNRAVDAHCAVTLLFEIAATGGVVATADVAAVHLDPYPLGVFFASPRFYNDITLAAALGWFAYKHVLLRLLRYRWRMLTVAGHAADVAIVALGVAAIGLRLQLLVYASHALRKQLAVRDAFVDLSHATTLVRAERMVLAAAAVVLWSRVGRFMQSVAPLAHVMQRCSRAGALLRACALLVALYVVGAAHVGAILFPAAHADFYDLDVSIASMGRALVGGGSSSDGASDASPVQQLFHVLFQLATTFALLNVAIVILRERFDSDRSSADSATRERAGDELLAVARQQLEARGMSVYDDASLAKKLRRAAVRGIDTLQHAARELFTSVDDAAELTSLQRVWGLSTPAAAASDCKTEPTESQRVQSQLRAAEALDNQLDEQLRYVAMRVGDATRKLETFQRCLRAQIDERDVLAAEHCERLAIAAAAAARLEAAERKRWGDEQRNVLPASLLSDTATINGEILSVAMPVTVTEPSAAPNVLLPGAVAATEDDDDDDDDENDGESAATRGARDDVDARDNVV